MTRDKAIEVICDMFNEAEDARDKIGQEALGMALEALKRDDELVHKTADALMDVFPAITNAIFKFINSEIKCSECHYYRGTWNVPVGRAAAGWELIDADPLGSIYECTNCHYHCMTKNYAYCPACGSAMKGENKND